VEKIGQGVGIGLALLFSTATAGVALWTGMDGHAFRMSAVVGGGFLAFTLPLGWLLGRRFDRLKQWAEKDSMTGTCTRRFLQLCFPKLVTQADRRGKRFSVLLLDVNDFKQVNDSLGHAKGDELLRKLAGALKGASRHGEITGRWGGDEFLLLCPYGDRASLESLNRGIEERLVQISSDWNRPLSVSSGCAIYPDDGRVLEELVQEADRRMYAEKHHRKEGLPQRLQA
jgi:diguanylate cyclase (GGDEF)-like protein